MTKFTEEIASLERADEEQMSELKMIASADTVARLINAARDDDLYLKLMKQIAIGWPDTPTNLPADLRPYHTFADELTVSCGLAYKGDQARSN